MPPVPFFIMGLMLGVVMTLLIQAYGRRKAHHAAAIADAEARRGVALLDNENDRRIVQIDRLQERIAVLERISTVPAERTAREIDALRDRAN